MKTSIGVQLQRIDTIITPIFRCRKKLSEAQGPTAGKWQSQEAGSICHQSHTPLSCTILKTLDLCLPPPGWKGTAGDKMTQSRKSDPSNRGSGIGSKVENKVRTGTQEKRDSGAWKQAPGLRSGPQDTTISTFPGLQEDTFLTNT